MSIALESNRNRMEQQPRFVAGMSRVSIFDTTGTEAITACNMGFPEIGEAEKAVRGQEHEGSDSSSSSSIGRNSDASGAASLDSGETEVQSSYKGPLETMDALVEVLPIKAISMFYGGKSNSCTSLADVSFLPPSRA